MGADHRLAETEALQLAIAADAHFHGHGQAVDLRIQGTQAVGQHFGQHGHDALGEIHRVTALAASPSRALPTPT
jgi:hypothetical protein